MRSLNIAWQHTEQELFDAYRHAPNPQVVRRFHALYLLRRGHPQAEVAALVGVARCTLTRWAKWYQTEGVAALSQRTHGGARRTATSLTPDEQAALRDYAATHGFRTQAETQQWIATRFGKRLTLPQVRGWFQRLGLRRKRPRPRAVRADAAAQAAWKKGGCGRR